MDAWLDFGGFPVMRYTMRSWAAVRFSETRLYSSIIRITLKQEIIKNQVFRQDTSHFWTRNKFQPSASGWRPVQPRSFWFGDY